MVILARGRLDAVLGAIGLVVAAGILVAGAALAAIWSADVGWTTQRVVWSMVAFAFVGLLLAVLSVRLLARPKASQPVAARAPDASEGPGAAPHGETRPPPSQDQTR